MRVKTRALVTVVVAAVVLVVGCQPTPTPPQARERASAWLINEFGSDGLIASEFDPATDDLGGTAYAVTSLAVAGTGQAVARKAVDALSGRINELVKDGTGQDRPGALARLILAAEATGLNPRTFGRTNLVARLEATMRRTGPDTGLFGAQDPTFDGAFRQGLALAALSLVQPRPDALRGGVIDDRPAVSWLRKQQCADGSWMPYRSDTTAPCAFDPQLFVGPDTNSTALAVLGLEAVDATGGTAAGSWFESVRSSDGGWSYNGGSGTSADPNSTGLVLGALRALGTPGDERAVDRLLDFQFDPDAARGERGAFFYPPFDASPAAPNLLATNDALLGLAPSTWPAVIDR